MAAADRPAPMPGSPWRDPLASAWLIAALLAAASGIALPSGAHAQSFNCRYARYPDEVLICQDDHLGQLDRQMTDLFFALRNRLGGADRDLLIHEQAAWLAARHRCGRDDRCIEQSCLRRIDELESWHGSGNGPGAGSNPGMGR